jgi:hypothetical protein
LFHVNVDRQHDTDLHEQVAAEIRRDPPAEGCLRRPGRLRWSEREGGGVVGRAFYGSVIVVAAVVLAFVAVALTVAFNGA